MSVPRGYAGTVSGTRDLLVLEGLALSRSGLDRRGVSNVDEDEVRRLLGTAGTRVHDLRGDRMRTCRVDGGARLLARDAERDDTEGLLLLVGTDPGGAAHLVRIHPDDEHAGAGAAGTEPASGGWQTLRECGPELDDRDVSVFTSAAALARWHERHPFCPRCGAPTVPERGGWARRCQNPQDASEHFPRTDPAVIVAVLDPDDRLLLANAAGWPERRMSVLAGFVEAGESLEATVVREVQEEVGVRVEDLVFRGDQPWPFPCSLMLGYTATTQDATITVDGAEIRHARWFERGELAWAVREGEVLLPSRVSIARHLIEDWYGAPLQDPGPSDPGVGAPARA